MIHSQIDRIQKSKNLHTDVDERAVHISKPDFRNKTLKWGVHTGFTVFLKRK